MLIANHIVLHRPFFQQARGKNINRTQKGINFIHKIVMNLGLKIDVYV
jgi:hypothetical protein